jgi:hypothetical protein
MKTALLTFIFIISGLWGISQTTYTWDGSSSTNWQTAANWTPDRNTPATNDILVFGGTGNKTITNVPSQTIGRLTITGTTNVTLQGAGGPPQTLTIGGLTGDDLVVETGRTLNIASNLENVALATNSSANIAGTYVNNSNYNTNNAGTTTTVSGSFTNSATVTGITAAKFTVSSTGIYNHDLDGGTIPTATWSAGSTLRIIGMTDNYPGGMTQSFSNVTFESDLNSNVEMSSAMSISGNLTIQNANGGSALRITNSNTSRNVTVGGNFIINSGEFTPVSNNGNSTLTVTGNFSQTGGTFILKEDVGNALLSVTGNFSKTGGTFLHRDDAAGTAVVTVTGNFSHTSGTYTFAATGGTSNLNVGGEFAVTGGTLTESSTGNGLVTFNGTGTQVYKSGATITNTVNFVVNNGSSLQFDLPTTTVVGGGTFTVQNGAFLGIRHAQGISTTAGTGQVQVTGTKTYNTGATYEYNGSVAQVTGNGLTGALNLNFDNSSVTAVSLTNNNIAVSANLLIRAGSVSAGAQTLNLGGNWTNNGTSFNAGTGNVILNGAGIQTLGGSTSTTFNNLNLNKTTGTVALGQSQNVNGTLNIGVNLDLGSFNLTMGASAGTIGTLGAGSFSATKMIVASGSGELRKVFGPATTTIYAFPIGDNTSGADYSPAAITFTTPSTSTGYVAFKVVDAKHPNNGHVNSFLTRYWTVTQSGLTTFTAQVGFTYVDADINGTEANIRLGKWDGQGPWTRYGAGSMNNPLNSMLSDAVGSFSDFSGLDFLEILPVNFGKFRGWAPNTNTNSIEWEVFGETGVDKYEIEKLSSGDVFRSIGVQSPSNNGLDVTYTFNDNAPNSGDNFYRIKATELTGEITYSPVVRVRNGGVTATAMKVYPNPVTGSTVNISLQGIKAGKYEMVVSNNAGQIIYRSSTEQRAGNVMIQIPVGNTLPKGIYRVKVSNGENVMLSSFIKE